MRSIPTYDLYGEAPPHRSATTPEFLLHCEDIYERSRIHGWEIKPHRHRHYFQILYIASGTADLGDGRSRTDLTLPAMVIVPARTVHGFRFSNDVEGFVLTIAGARLETLIGAETASQLCGTLPRAVRLDQDKDEAARIVGALRAIPGEYRSRAPGYAALIEAGLVEALVRANRLAPNAPHDVDPAGDGMRLVTLARLIDLHYREHRPVAFYADALGLSATHLNRILKRERQTTIQKWLAARLIDEAKRALVFSVQSVKAIALGLGFSDTAYFTRFFQRETGMSPTAYRRVHQDRMPATSERAQ